MKRDIASYRTRLQDEAQAEQYAARFERGSRARIDRREQRAVRTIFSELTDCHSVLDVPCGAGRFAKTLAEGGRRVLGADSAMEILLHAQKRAVRLGVRAGFIHGDASRLPLPQDAVDAVFCNRLLHHITKPEERSVILRELRRVSRRYVVVSFFDYQGFGTVRRMLKSLKGSKPKYAGQPTREQFEREAGACGLRVRELVSTGAAWVSQKYFVLEKVR
jgi:ubiquinone/menaquinone biosynthesis C-methylase UbiE